MMFVCLDGTARFSLDSNELPDVCVALGRIDDHMATLNPVEAKAVFNASESRKREFSSGRRVAHQALKAFKIEKAEIPRNQRMPVWPQGIVGSISHSDTLAVAIVGSNQIYGGLGIDVIPLAAVSSNVATRVLVETELRWLAEVKSGEWRTALYSAKESVYKAVNPTIGEFLRFEDVEIDVATSTLEFTAKTSRILASSQAIDSGRGYFRRVEGHWITVFSFGPL